MRVIKVYQAKTVLGMIRRLENAKERFGNIDIRTPMTLDGHKTSIKVISNDDGTYHIRIT